MMKKKRKDSFQTQNTTQLIYYYTTICKADKSAMKWNGPTPTRSHLSSDIQRKVISTRIVSSPRFPLSAPTKMYEWVAHTSQRLFGFKRETKGEYKAFCIGGVLPKERH